MYEIEEGTGDYQPEGVVPGMEIERSNVLILQDRDMGEMDTEELGGYLASSFEALESILNVNALVNEALTDTGKATAVLLRKAQAARISAAKNHGGSIAVEAACHPTTVIFALEEESKREVGLIARIIDNIIKAFKWLWKKITGVFRSKDPKKRDEELDSAIESSEKAESSGVQASEVGKMEAKSVLEKREASIKRVSSRLAAVDATLNPSALISYYKRLQNEIPTIEKMCVAGGSAFNLYEKTISQLSPQNLTEGGSVIMKVIPEMLMASAASLEQINASSAAAYATSLDADAIGAARRLQNIVHGKDLVVIQVGKNDAPANQIKSFYRGLSKSQPAETSKIHILSSQEQRQLGKELRDLGKKISAMNERIAKAAETARNPDSLRQIVKLFENQNLSFEGSGGSAMAAQFRTIVSTVGSDISNFVKTVAVVATEMNSIHDLGCSWVKECSGILNDAARDLNKGE